MTVMVMKGRYVVAFDGREHRLLENGEVAWEGSKITYVGPKYPGPAERVIDAGNALVGPGFVDLNALGDLDSTVLGFDNHPDWAKGRVWAADYLARGPREVYTPEEQAFKMRYAFVQLIRNGITTALPITSMFYREWAETYDEFVRSAETAAALGIRVYLGPCHMSGMSIIHEDGTIDQHWDEARGLEGLQRTVDFVQRFDGAHDGLIRGMLAPDRIETCTPELLRRTAAVSRDLDCPVRLHCCQSLFELELVEKLRGCTPIEWLDSLGFLSERALLPHGVYVTGHREVKRSGDDLGRVLDAGASIVHCPVVAVREGMVLESFRRYRRRGINIGLGTDTYPPDFVENMRQGVNLCRVVERDKAACSAADFYTAATLGGARALRRDDLGRLAPGALADITVFDLSGFHLGQFVDPVQTMVLSGSGRDFRTVVVNGRVVMEEGAIPGVDFEAMRERAQRQYDKLRSTYPERTWRHPPVEQIFQPSFAWLREEVAP